MATALWTAVVVFFQRWRLWHQLHQLNGTYQVTPKGATQPDPEESVVIRVDKNLLVVDYRGLAGGESAQGQIAMNEHLPASGRGLYTHGHNLWGFWDVQVKDTKTLLVHTSYFNAELNALVVAGYVWRQLDS